MTGAFIVGTAIGGAILLIATIGLIIMGIIKVSKSGGLSKKEKKINAEETRMIQDIYYGLSKMEERIEALETILMERQREDFNK